MHPSIYHRRNFIINERDPNKINTILGETFMLVFVIIDTSAGAFVIAKLSLASTPALAEAELRSSLT